MKWYQLVAVGLGGIVVLALASYAIFALLLVGFDVASYSSDGVTVADLEFEEVLSNAEAAGYTVERVDSSGFHPGGIDELDAELGPEYEAFRVIFDHSDATRMWATFYADEGITVVTFFADDVSGPFTVEHLPSDEWVIDRLTLSFEMDEATAANYLEELKDEIRTGDPSAPGAHTPSLEIRESVDFPSIDADLTNRATSVNASSSSGSGWHERVYYAHETRIGGLDFVLARATVTYEADGHTFRVHVDYHGGVSVGAETRPYRNLEEEEVRTVIRGMFDELGIPPDTIDHLHLEYRGSVW